MYIGIDVGGTNLKAGLVEEGGTILRVERMPLGAYESDERFAEKLARLAGALLKAHGLGRDAVSSVGIGIPGAVAEGKVLYTCNIPMENVALEDLFRRYLDLPVLLENDANCAAVGEWLCGAGRGCRDVLVVTLGTGVGGGMILGGRLYGGGGAAGEVGHMVIHAGGEPCSCGRRGCWEAYSAAPALIRRTKQVMEQEPGSLLHAVAREKGTVDGETVFTAAQRGDGAALALCEAYAADLACGVNNLLNILHPQVLAVGGGISGAPEELLMQPLRRYVQEECYARHVSPALVPRIVRAELGNDAGLIGAALLSKAI